MRVNGIMIFNISSPHCATLSIPKDLKLHPEYDHVFISRRNGSMFDQRKRKHQDWTAKEMTELYLVRRLSSSSTAPLTGRCRDI